MPVFVPRLTEEGMRYSRYYYSENPFYLSGYGPPNCTWYAWGRFWEASGIRPYDNAMLGNARDWYGSSGAYNRGPLPALGAIACYSYAPYGHVAVVEEIYPDGTILVSESGYSGGFYFRTRRTDTNYCQSWMYNQANFYFQGFIYPPGVSGVGAVYHFISINDYQTLAYMTDDVKNNCYCVASALLSDGWSLEGICGLLGNAIHESYCAPDMHEVGGSGYGIVQWTPPTKITNYLDANFPGWQSDIDINGYGQCDRINWEVTNSDQWIATGSYPMSFAEFTVSTQTPEYLAAAFIYNYERPASYSSLPDRQTYARWIYNIFLSAPPGMAVPTGRGKLKKKNALSIWQMIRYH